MRRVVWVGAVMLLLGAAPNALASQLLDRDGTQVRIKVNDQGRALVTYTKDGHEKNVIVWGAVNALPPSTANPQVKFRFDYSGNDAKGFKGACGRYDGPSLPYLVATCKAGDGSYWAVQEWPRPLPDLGYTPWLPSQQSLWMNVSHWTGPVAELDAYPDWVYSGNFHSLFGRYTYHGVPVHGFGTTNVGVPTDTYGRLLYLDTYGSTYGAGWGRENSFVSHNPTGVFCYGFFPFDPTKGGYQHPPNQTTSRGPGIGSRYRLIGLGPGVTPDVQATVIDLGDFASSGTNVALRLKQWRLFSTFIGVDKQCRQGRALGAVNVVVQKSWFSSAPGGESTTSFTLTSPLYFNVQFGNAPPSSNRMLNSASVTWVHKGYNTTRFQTTAVGVSSGGVVASAPFDLKNQNNRRFVGSWTATLVLNGLTLAEGTIDASLVPGTLINLTPPVVTGAPTVGSTLTASAGTWSFSPTRITFNWYRCPPKGGQCVGLSTASAYTPVSADVGWVINVSVSAWASSGRSIGSGAYVGAIT